MKIDIVSTPRLLPVGFNDALCVVIDVLRATTTIITALAHGASEVCPCITGAEARRRAQLENSMSFLLGGERRGLRIPGFHLGNSPLEYLDSSKMAGKVIYFSTTNGTPALRQAFRGSARSVYLAALVNLSAASTAVAKAAANKTVKKILLICAGRHGQPALEDFYCAGLMAQRLKSEFADSGILPELSDAAIPAAEYSMMNLEKPLAVFTATEHGRYLKDIGFAADLKFASQIDKYDIVPHFDGKRIII